MNKTYDNSTSHLLRFKSLSCIRFGWIYTDWRGGYKILVIGISSDSIANKAICIFQYRRIDV